MKSSIRGRNAPLITSLLTIACGSGDDAKQASDGSVDGAKELRDSGYDGALTDSTTPDMDGPLSTPDASPDAALPAAMVRFAYLPSNPNWPQSVVVCARREGGDWSAMYGAESLSRFQVGGWIEVPPGNYDFRWFTPDKNCESDTPVDGFPDIDVSPGKWLSVNDVHGLGNVTVRSAVILASESAAVTSASILLNDALGAALPVPPHEVRFDDGIDLTLLEQGHATVVPTGVSGTARLRYTPPTGGPALDLPLTTSAGSITSVVLVGTTDAPVAILCDDRAPPIGHLSACVTL